MDGSHDEMLLGASVLEEEYAAYREDSQPALRQASVLFLDALGTRALSSGDDAQEHLQRTYRAIALARSLGNLTDDIPQVARWFSDNLIFALRAWEDRQDDPSFGTLVIAAAWVQLALVLEGIPARGGIQVGPFHAGPQFVYGPALNDAYELEANLAVYPRIVLGDRAVEQAVAEVLAGETETYKAMLALDTDGLVFVNYLADVFADSDEQALDILTQHRNFIAERLKRHREDSKLAAKYEWMAAYHDWYVSENFRADIAQGLLLDPSRPHGFRAFQLPDPSG